MPCRGLASVVNAARLRAVSVGRTNGKDSLGRSPVALTPYTPPVCQSPTAALCAHAERAVATKQSAKTIQSHGTNRRVRFRPCKPEHCCRRVVLCCTSVLCRNIRCSVSPRACGSLQLRARSLCTALRYAASLSCSSDRTLCRRMRTTAANEAERWMFTLQARSSAPPTWQCRTELHCMRWVSFACVHAWLVVAGIHPRSKAAAAADCRRWPVAMVAD